MWSYIPTLGRLRRVLRANINIVYRSLTDMVITYYREPVLLFLQFCKEPIIIKGHSPSRSGSKAAGNPKGSKATGREATVTGFRNSVPADSRPAATPAGGCAAGLLE
jgi:hypothetical protein